MGGIVVESDGGSERFRHPVERDAGQQLVLGEAGFEIPAAFAPAPEFLDDPRGQAGGRVVHPVGEGLRSGALELAVGALVLLPGVQHGLIAHLLGGQRRCARPEPGRQHRHDVDAVKYLRVIQPEPVGHAGSDVPAVRGKPGIPEMTGHELAP